MSKGEAGSSTAVANEVKKRIPHDPRLYLANHWQHPEDPSRNYDFYDETGENYLYYLADDEGPLNPRQWGDINVLKFCRGGLKTTTCVGIMNWGVDAYPNIEVDVTAPVKDQTGEVMDRFKGYVKQSGMDRFRTKNNVSHQKFERTVDINGEDRLVTSDVKSRSSYGEGDSLRGLHGHIGVVDEFQDVNESMFSNFIEVVDRRLPQVPYFPVIFIIGTPKMANTFFHTLWEQSDQKTWDREEREWIAESDATVFSHSDEAQGGYQVRGWHLDQYNSPRHDEDTIEFKRQSPNISKREFKNEILAEFYTPENDLLTNTDVAEACDDTLHPLPSRRSDDSLVVVGVDWGGGQTVGASETVIGVGEVFGNDEQYRIEVPKITFVDQDATKQDELELVEDAIRDYKADRVLVDEGHGSKRREDLRNGNGIWNENGWDNVYGCIYGNIKDKDQPKPSDTDDPVFYTVNRTHMIENMVSAFKDGRFTVRSEGIDFSGRESKGKKLVDHLSAPYTELDETSDGKRKKKVLNDRNDDAFHVFTYIWIAARKLGSQRTLKSIRTTKRAGY